MTTSLLSAGLGATLTLLIALSGRPLRNTTLIGPWMWGILSGLLLTTAALSAWRWPFFLGTWHGLTTYAAAVSTLCPLVALLGARRPQGSIWQFVVAALLLVLLVPAFQSSGSSRLIILEPPWSWFLLGFVIVGLLNALPTRYWPAAAALALGQLVLLSPHWLPSADGLSDSSRMMTGRALLIAAVQLYRWRTVAAWSTADWQKRDPLDRLWIDFRDAFGTLWALRVQQRVNSAAAQFGWPVVLAWDGFRDQSSGAPITAVPGEVRGAVEHVLRTVLWRFMSESWIEARLTGN